ncbi:uncharacterized protein LOC34623089 [Cyclospora cayetanensis]|uniref:Ubiquitin n=2 Tax=Cyclospora cayetanensis TaxID=88456 RepID=A0A1D3CZP7_9EIME|nr:uncharacterized protein LOC34623089 [Cyclospora cayetanensis]OEH76658.1 putative ubiquitin [Cyclospora cayetanensis]
MPNGEVTLVLSDWTKDKNGDKHELPGVSMESTILNIKKLVLKELSMGSREPESILLYMGTVHLENEKLLKEFNKSNRSKLSVNVYDRVDLNLRVKTLQHCGSGGCVCVPLWSFLCRQTINIKISDYKSVRDLKELIADELNDPDRYTAANIKLTFSGSMLFDDSQSLKDVGLKNNSTLTLFVDCLYWKKSAKGSGEGAANKPQGAAAPGEQRDCVGAPSEEAESKKEEREQGAPEGSQDTPKASMSLGSPQA